MRMTTKRKFFATLGVAILLFQFYKWVTNQMFDWKIELVVCVIAVAFLLDPKYILSLFEKVITRKKED